MTGASKQESMSRIVSAGGSLQSVRGSCRDPFRGAEVYAIICRIRNCATVPPEVPVSHIQYSQNRRHEMSSIIIVKRTTFAQLCHGEDPLFAIGLQYRKWLPQTCTRRTQNFPAWIRKVAKTPSDKVTLDERFPAGCSGLPAYSCGTASILTTMLKNTRDQVGL